MTSQIQLLTTQFSSALTPTAGANPTAPPTPVLVPSQGFHTAQPIGEPRVGVPKRYSIEEGGCNPFLTNCSILFSLQPLTFSTEGAKVAFVINPLTGHARLWGTAEWERQTPACSCFQPFSGHLL